MFSRSGHLCTFDNSRQPMSATKKTRLCEQKERKQKEGQFLDMVLRST